MAIHIPCRSIGGCFNTEASYRASPFRMISGSPGFARWAGSSHPLISWRSLPFLERATFAPLPKGRFMEPLPGDWRLMWACQKQRSFPSSGSFGSNARNPKRGNCESEHCSIVPVWPAPTNSTYGQAKTRCWRSRPACFSAGSRTRLAWRQ